MYCLGLGIIMISAGAFVRLTRTTKLVKTKQHKADLASVHQSDDLVRRLHAFQTTKYALPTPMHRVNISHKTPDDTSLISHIENTKKKNYKE